jgi:hypothetical protein
MCCHEVLYLCCRHANLVELELPHQNLAQPSYSIACGWQQHAASPLHPSAATSGLAYTPPCPPSTLTPNPKRSLAVCKSNHLIRVYLCWDEILTDNYYITIFLHKIDVIIFIFRKKIYNDVKVHWSDKVPSPLKLQGVFR